MQSLDQHKVTALILLDLSAAFDTIDHRIFLNRKMGTSLKWMTSYLTDRYQTVCIDGELLEAVHTTYSVRIRIMININYLLSAICTKNNISYV